MNVPDELRHYYHLKDRDLSKQGVGIVEGHTLVRRLAASGRHVLSVLCVQGQEHEYQSLFGDVCPVFVMNHDDIQKLIGFKFHRGVLAAVQRPDYSSLQDLPDVYGAGGGEPGSAGLTLQRRIVLCCTAIQEGSNLGAIIRSARAFGIRDVVLGPKSADPYSRKAIRASAGHVFTVNLYMGEGLETDAQTYRKKQYVMLAAESGKNGARPLRDYLASERPASEVLILGHEYEGLSAGELALMDELIEITMTEGIDSLNVGVAAGIFMFGLTSS